jgi:2-polyprenyl-3-methyl-5-hydroxy-6-metoxy-1,4-benzoquinol methylase
MKDAVAWHSQISRSFDEKYSTSDSFRERFSVWSDLIERYVPEGASVVDAGCGSGVMAEAVARRGGEVFGFDGSPEMIAIANARKSSRNLLNVTFATGRLGDTALLADKTFDVALCSSVLEYVDDCWESFDWLASSVKPNGTVIFSMPNGASAYRWMERATYRVTGRPAYYAHVRHVPHPADVDTILRERTFGVIDTRFYARAPLLSRPARAIGRPEMADCLFVKVCRRTA